MRSSTKQYDGIPTIARVVAAFRLHARRLCCSGRAAARTSREASSRCCEEIPCGTHGAEESDLARCSAGNSGGADGAERAEAAEQLNTAELAELHESEKIASAMSASLQTSVRIAGTELHWMPGDLVERLLDDVSDIWAGAVVLVANEENGYDITYVDNGSVEKGVEASELRRRKARLDLPSEVWETVGSCLHVKGDLCTFEQIALASWTATQENTQSWWCTAFHERFGRCGGRCQFERVIGADGSRLGAAAVQKCYTASRLELSPMDKIPWKARYIDQERLMDVSRRSEENLNNQTPGDSAYTVSGKKVMAGDSLKGWFFDPRLGRMVREC